MGIVSDAPAEFVDQARLPDSGLAYHKDELPTALACLLPSVEKQAHLVRAPHERRLCADRRPMLTPARYRLLDHSIELDRMHDAFESLLPSILDYE
jgi:hypothetical protein